MLLAKSPKIKSIEAQILLRESYETIYGIYNHDVNDPEHPLALVEFHEAEDNTTGSLLHERLDMFAQKQVHKWFGISWPEFVAQPTDLCLRMLEIAGKKQDAEDSTTTGVLAQLGGGNR